MRSNYNIQFNCNPNIVEQIMQSYLSTNNFKMVNDNGENYYKKTDIMFGDRGLSYSINGQLLNLTAWIKLLTGDSSLEDNNTNPAGVDYKNSLSTAVQAIANASNQNNNIQQGYRQNNYNTNPNQEQNTNNANQYAQNFKNEANKKSETGCEIAFWMSILGFLFSFFGVTYGVIIYILEIYFATIGLKTRKRKKAIATIVLAIISIIIIVIELVSTKSKIGY